MQARALATIDRLALTSDESASLEALATVAQWFRADQAAFAVRLLEPGVRDEFHLAVDGDQAWSVRYQQGRHYEADAWLRHCMLHTAPATDDEIRLLTDAENETRCLALRHGIVSALVVPAPASYGVSRFGMLMLGSVSRHHFASTTTRLTLPLARALAMQLHDQWLTRNRRALLRAHRVTEDDMVLLRFERDGLGTKEISALIGLSTATVDSRFRRLNDKLSQPNRKASAAFATVVGIIEPKQRAMRQVA
jgi:DNA-binding NarL/FixJ family response regulator